MFRYISSFIFLATFFSASMMQAQPWVEWTGKDNPTFDEIQHAFYSSADSLGIDADDAFYRKFKRWEHKWEKRLMPDRTLPTPSFIVDIYKNMSGGKKGGSILKNAPGDWVDMGPDSSAGSYMANGRVNTIAFDPSNSNRWLVGTPIGGIWLTTNAGSTWAPLTDQSAVFQPIGVTDIEFAPNNSSIVYAATGDGYGTNSYSLGVIKSTDGGQTWNSTGLDWANTNFRTIKEIIVHPTNSNTVYAATSAGIWMTTDGGTNWERTLNTFTWDIAFNTSNPNIMYASTREEFYRSTNGGLTWTQITAGFPNNTSIHRIEIATTKADANYVYALVANVRNLYGVYRSTDGGQTWSLRHSQTNLLGYVSDGSDTGGQAFYDLAICVSDSDRDLVYVGGVNLHRSTNGGSNWECVGVWTGSGNFNKNNAPVVHADQHSMEIHPSTGELFVTNDGGLYSTDNQGTSWDWLGEGLSITQFYDIDVVAANPDRMIGGTQDNGTKVQRDNGNWYNPIGGDGFQCYIDPSDPDNMFGELYYGEIFGSGNGGQSFFRLSHEWDQQQNDFVNKTGENGDWETPYILNPKKSSTILVGYFNVWRSHNFLQEDDYENISNINHTNTIQTVGMSPVDTNRIIFSYRQNNNNVIRKSNDGGQTWSDISSPSSQPLQDIVFHGSNEEIIWLIFGGYTNNQKVYYSDDYGATFTNISSGLPNLPANCGKFQTDAKNRIWIGNDVGVYYTDDETSGWVQFGENLPYTNIEEIDLDLTARMIYAGTYGRGIWRAELPIDIERPELVSPPNNDEYVSRDTMLTWTQAIGASSYQWQLATDDTFTNIVQQDSAVADTSISLSTLDFYTTYYWRIRAWNGGASSNWTDTWRFTTTIDVPVLSSPPHGSVAVDIDTVLTWEAVNGATGYILELDDSPDFSSLVYSSPSLSTNQTTTSQMGLEFGKVYYWRVKALHMKGETDYSTPFSFSTIIGGVTLISPKDSISNVNRPVEFLWTERGGATGYDIEISDLEDFSQNTILYTDITDTFYIDSSLLASKYYYWRARAKDAESTSRWSDIEAFRTRISAPTLTFPENSVEGVDPNNAQLAWEHHPSSILDSLELYLDAALTQVVNKRSLTDTTYQYAGLTGGTTYYWRVASSDDYGWSEWSDVFAFTTRISGFSQISPLNGAKTLGTIDTLEWNAANGADSYKVQLAKDSLYNDLVIDTTGLTELSLPLANLEKGQIYYWRVQAVSGSTNSEWTTTWSFQIIFSPLSLVSPDNGAVNIPSSTELEWENITGAEYTLMLSINSDLSSPILQETVSDNLKAVNLDNSTSYYWAVEYSINGNGSELSPIWEFTTEAPLGQLTITNPKNGNTMQDTVVEVTWTEAQGADSYDLELIDLADNSVVISITDITETSYTVSNLNYFGNYTVRVRAVSGNQAGDWVTSNFGTKLRKVEKKTPTRGGKFELPFSQFEFSPVLGGDEYRIDISDDIDGMNIVYTSTAIDTVITPVEMEELEAGDYWWNVTALSADGRESDPELWQFELVPASSVKSYMEMEYGLTVYPNPSPGRFTIKTNRQLPSEMQVKVYDVKGRFIQSLDFDRSQTASGTATIDLHEVNNGSYVLWISSGKLESRITVVVKK